MSKINIIDPSSTEFNRGSFCYAPYLLYNGLKEDNNDVVIYETFLPENLDSVKDADIQIICLWSYPQIDTCMLLYRFLTLQYGKHNIYFSGYSPLIESLGLPNVSLPLGFDPLSDSEFLKTSMLHYPKYYKDFSRLLLSDCDMHLASLEKGNLVHPLFTTYGCPNGCAFCPSTKNCRFKRIELSLEDTFSLLDACISGSVFYIHFTDEDFFYDIDRAFAVLSYMKGKRFHAIALGSADKVLNFLRKYTDTPIKDAGLEVIEIGFESGEEAISYAMGAGKSLNSCETLAAMQHLLSFRIFWLVLTFFPGETIKSLNITGEFLETYGLNKEDVVGRLQTNGTKGGLGQFFQPYDGLKIFKRLKGEFLTERPIRLLPSFIPDSFLDSSIQSIDILRIGLVEPWLKLYGVSLDGVTLYTGCSVRFYTEDKTWAEKVELYILFALLARWRVIS